MSLLLKNISLQLPAFTLETSLEVRGGVTALFGPSGAGKTSLLDVVAGLRRASSAFIQLDGQILTDTAHGVFVPPRRRGIGYVPQDLALFPHLCVRRNLLYGHRRNGHDDGRFAFDHVVEVLEIQPFLDRGVTGLSGGEQQRVALARALLTSPRLLLLDEPLGSLDTKLKNRILPYFARIRNEFRTPMLYVTHDRFEALAIADDMIVLTEGKVAQTGSVQDIFARPASLEIAGIVGTETILPGRVVKRDEDLVSISVGSTHLTALEQNIPANTGEVYVCIRAEDVILARGNEHGSSPRNHLPSVVVALSSQGSLVRVEVDCGFRLAALLTRQACEELALDVGTSVMAMIKAPQIHVIPR